MSERRFTGRGWIISEENLGLSVGNLPGRKSVCLYTEKNGTIKVLAFFKDVESATIAIAVLEKMIMEI